MIALLAKFTETNIYMRIKELEYRGKVNRKRLDLPSPRRGLTHPLTSFVRYRGGTIQTELHLTSFEQL